MSGFVLHPDALTDLNEIWEYIAADNSSAADRILEEIYEAIRALVPFPQVGHTRSGLTSRLAELLRAPTAGPDNHR